MKCAKCNSDDVQERDVDERKIYECFACGRFWYSNRSWSSGPYSILDDIADDVAVNGMHETFWSVLLNCVFRQDSQSDCSPEDQLAAWAQNHRFRFDIVDGRDRFGKKQQLVRFYRLFNKAIPRPV